MCQVGSTTPIHSRTVTMEMAPSTSLPIQCPSCRARPPLSSVGHSSRNYLNSFKTGVYETALQRSIILSIKPNPSYLRNDLVHGMTVWWRHRGKHLGVYRRRVRRHHSRERTRGSQLLPMGRNNSKDLRPTNNMPMPVVPRANRQSCRIRCSVNSRAPNGCRPSRPLFSRRLPRVSGTKDHRFHRSMGADTILHKTGDKVTCKACSTEGKTSLSRPPQAQTT